MQNKILKIRLVKFANTPPIISAWNIFDTDMLLLFTEKDH